jgi:hypothetical protein
MRARRSAAAISAVLACTAAPAAPVTVEAVRHGEAIDIRASAQLQADGTTAWRVLTDYARYVDFIPHLRSCQVTARRGAVVTVQQEGEAALWWFKLPVRITYEITEQPPSRLQSHAIAGNLRSLDSVITLTPDGTGLRLDYSGRVVPGFALPGAMEQAAVERNIGQQFQALADEIERQAGKAP